MRLLDSIKHLFQAVPNPLRKKIYRVRTAGGTDWFVPARMGQPGWERTDTSPKEYHEKLAAAEEITDMIESGDFDERRFMELNEKYMGKKCMPRKIVHD